MAAVVTSLVHDVEAAISSGDADRRVAMLRQMTSLFTGQAASLAEAQVEAFDGVILRLARDIETEARAELSERLADIANAPRAVVRDLAFDPSVSVAGPVLERSTRLDEGDLVQVAQERGQGHLMALTRRASLSERVTDVLVTRGDRDVVHSVARNDGARFSHAGHTTLVRRAVDDAELRDSLQQRGDIPPAYRKRLLVLARERAQAALSDEFGEAACDAAGKAAQARQAPARDDALLAAEVAVASRARSGEIDEGVVTDLLRMGEETEALVALARVAGVPSRIAIQAFEAESYEPLLFLVRSAKFGWRLLKLFMAVKAAKEPPPEVMQGAMEAFQALSVASAQRIVRFTATRERAQA